MKTLFALALLALTTTLQAQTYAWVPLVDSGTATCAATAGTNVAKVINTTKQSTVPVQIELMADANGAYTFTLPFQSSVDNSTFAGMAAQSVAISFNGVTKQTIVTNIPTYGVGYLKVPHLTNATAAINITNIVIKYGIKTGI